MLAVDNYHEAFDSFPPPFTRNREGKRLHSWRTLILPYLDQQILYDRLRLNEPWDSAHNFDVTARFGDEVRWIFQCPNHPNRGDRAWSETSYLAIVGPRTVWQVDRRLSYREVTDGTANTLSVIEVAKSEIHWMEPFDLEVEQMFPKISFVRGERISSYHGSDSWGVETDGCFVGLLNGAVRFLPASLPDNFLEQLVTIDDGLPLDGWGDRIDRSR